MKMNLASRLGKKKIHTSVPCRVDFGGTLDISTFYLTLAHLAPVSLNLALDMRTRVTLAPYTRGMVKVSSRGFESAQFPQGRAPFDHPMGLIFACVEYFNGHGVHVIIDSSSPPRSALGGSSSASVAVLAAFMIAMEKRVDPSQIAWLSHYIESGVAGVVCGVQDQAAAAFGSAHLWQWKMGRLGPEFDRTPLFKTRQDLDRFNDHILVAYCGIPHVSKDINKQWVEGFVRGDARNNFKAIVGITKDFFAALQALRYADAGELMNRETRLRLEMTPEVLDVVGKKLFALAGRFNCGARFTGAGGGGCVWAVGEAEDIERLAPAWENALGPVQNAKLLDTRIDPHGIVDHTEG